MVRGFYNAASGMLTQQRKLNVMLSNVANVSTAGYKKDVVTSVPFGEHLVTRIEEYNQAQGPDIGEKHYIRTTDDVYTIQEQGILEPTGRSVDMAIVGEGFFLVGDEENRALTRNGQFEVDAEGYLYLPQLGRVQGESGEIAVGTSSFSVTVDGSLYVGGELIDKLLIVMDNDPVNMEKSGEGFFAADDYIVLEDNTGYAIKQGYIERSNVDMAEEMTRIIAAQRSFQSCAQVIKTYDEMSTKSINELAKV